MKTLINLTVILILALITQFTSCGNNPSAPAGPNLNPAKYGKLSITISGLPPGMQANATVTGPSSYSRSVTADIVLDSLPIGSYSVETGYVIDDSGDTIQTTTPSQTVEVKEGETSTVVIIYQSTLVGSLAVNIAGLPSGESGYIRLLQPDFTFIQEITGSIQINSMSIGSYILISADVTVSGDRLFTPDQDTIKVTILSGQTTTVTVTYEEAIGSLQVDINGLPSGDDGFVKVYKRSWNPSNGEYIEVVSTTLLDSLGAGDYTVEAIDVTLTNGDIYRPEHYLQTITVFHKTLSAVEVKYFSRFGEILLQSTGLPGNVSAEVSITNLGTQIFDGSVLVESVDEGTYTITSWDLTGPDGQVWVSDPKTQEIDVFGGETAQPTPINYTPKFGFLRIQVDGLADEFNDADIIVKDTSNTNWLLRGTETLDPLMPGPYTILANPVVPDGDSLFPTPDSIVVDVTAGNTRDVTIEYKGFTFHVFTDPKHPRQRIAYNDRCDSVRESDEFLSDTVSSIDGGYLYGDCTILNHDITLTGSSKLYELVGTFSSGSLTDDITVDKNQRRVTITKTIEVLAVAPTCSVSGVGNIVIISEGTSAGSRLSMEINNPFLDTILIHVSGSGTATASYTSTQFTVSDIFSSCSNTFAFFKTNCSFNPVTHIDTIPQLQVSSYAYANWPDPTRTYSVSLSDTVIVETTDPFIFITFFRDGAAYTNSQYWDNKSTSGTAIVTSDINVWVERRRVNK